MPRSTSARPTTVKPLPVSQRIEKLALSIRRGKRPVAAPGGSKTGDEAIETLALEVVAGLLKRVQRLEELEAERAAQLDKRLSFGTAEQLVQRVCQLLNVDVDTLRSPCREKAVATARWMAAGLLSKCEFTQAKIAKAVGWRATTSAHYGLERHAECLAASPHYARVWAELSQEAVCG